MGRQSYAMFRLPVSVEDAPARKTPFYDLWTATPCGASNPRRCECRPRRRSNRICPSRFRLIYWHEAYETATPSDTSNPIHAERKETERRCLARACAGRIEERAHTSFRRILLACVEFCRRREGAVSVCRFPPSRE